MTAQHRPLVLAAHGTDSPAGRAVVEEVASRAASILGVDHRVGYVDVCGPTLAEALDEVLGLPGGAPVVVPFFLATGYHVKHDVPGAVAGARASGLTGAVVTPALGVEPEVLAALADRVRSADSAVPDLAASGRAAVSDTAASGPAAVSDTAASGPAAVSDTAASGPDGVEAIVLVAAGSSHDDARAEVATTAAQLGAEFDVPGHAAYLSGPGPRPEDVVRELDPGEQERFRILLVVHLLAPGFFADRARTAAARLGTRVTSEPLGTDPQLVNLVVRRYVEATTP